MELIAWSTENVVFINNRNYVNFIVEPQFSIPSLRDDILETFGYLQSIFHMATLDV